MTVLVSFKCWQGAYRLRKYVLEAVQAHLVPKVYVTFNMILILPDT